MQTTSRYPPRITERSKKVLPQPLKWKRNASKALRDAGQQYVGYGNKIHEARSVQPYHHTCRYKCSNTFSEIERKSVFDEFWGLKSWDLQTSFLASCIKIKTPKRKKKSNDNINGNKSFCTFITLRAHRVCKQFFLKTLDLSNKRFINVARRKSENGISPPDRRGRHIPWNRTPQEAIDLIKNHINSFPRYTSHYTREKSPNRKYLNSNLSIKKMYELYKEMCENKTKPPVKE